MIVADTFTANYSDSLKVCHIHRRTGRGDADHTVAHPVSGAQYLLRAQSTLNDKRTAIDILAAARPKRLLIHIGVNDGLWKLLLMADPSDFADRINPIPTMRTLALHLKEFCPATEHFYVYLFPKPSAIANLMPPWSGGDEPIPTNGYYDKYVGNLLSNGGIARAQMQQIDSWVRDNLNSWLKTHSRRSRTAFTSSIFMPVPGRIDRKNGINTSTVICTAAADGSFCFDNQCEST